CPRHLEFLGQVHAGAGALFAVSQRRVENHQAFGRRIAHHCGSAGRLEKKALESLDSRAVVRYRMSYRRDCVPLESLSCEKEKKVQEGEQLDHAHTSYRAISRGVWITVEGRRRDCNGFFRETAEMLRRCSCHPRSFLSFFR